MNDRIKFTPPIKCEYCNNLLRLEIRATYLKGEIDETHLGDGYDKDNVWKAFIGDEFNILHCPTCEGVLLSKHYRNDLEGDDGDRQILYPSTSKIPVATPASTASPNGAPVLRFVRTVGTLKTSVIICLHRVLLAPPSCMMRGKLIFLPDS